MKSFNIIGPTQTLCIKKRENEVRSGLKEFKVLMTGANKIKEKKRRLKGRIILTIRKEIAEELNDGEDFIPEEFIGSRFKIKGKE